MSGLRVIQFSAEDYRIADVLSRPNLEQIQDPAKISAAVSLYFQWPEHRQAFIKLDGEEYQPIELAIDTDLAVPDELFVNFSTKIKLDSSKPVRVRFEVFKTCFEYSTAVLADLSPDFDFTSLVIPIPSELYVHKARTSPRYGVPTEHPLRKINFTYENKQYPCELKNISVKSLLISGLPEKCNSGQIQLGKTVFDAEQIKDTQFGKVFKLHFPTHKEYGAFFDCFIQIAYPNLRPRYDFDHETIYNLYVETGYLSRFGETVVDPNDPNSITEEERKSRIIKYWKDSEKDEHDYKVDYVLVDGSGKPIGASGLAKIFKEEDGKDIWAFHQLMILKNPELILKNSELYQWRTDYLEGLDKQNNFVTWYRSDSKWLDRIFTKIAIPNSNEIKLTPVRLLKHYLEFTPTRENSRTSTKHLGAFVGIGPEYLNASRLFEMLWIRDPAQLSETACLSMFKEIAKNSTPEKYEIRICAPMGSDLYQNSVQRPTDRCMEFKNEALVILANSIIHSLAVTSRRAAIA